MNKTVSRLLALAMTASLVLSGCGGGGTTTEEKPAEGGNTTEQSGEKKEEVRKRIRKKPLKTRLKIWFVRLLHLVSWKPSTFCTLRELRTMKT